MSMQFVAVIEPDVAISERSELSIDILAGVLTIPVKNVGKFVANKYICLGRLGEETSELKRIDAVDTASQTITVDSVTEFPHYLDDPIVEFLYGHRKFYRYDSVTATWTHLTSEGSPKEISVDNQQGTYFEDSDGTRTDIYKSTYVNTTDSIETSIEDAKAITGGGTSTDLISIFRIRYSAGFKDNYNIEDNFIDEYRQEAQGEVFAALRGRFTFPLTKNSSFLRNIVRDLAVGKIWLDQFAGDAEKSKTAQYKIETARKLLKGLAEADYSLYDEVVGTDNTENEGAGGLGFFPDEHTEDTDDERIFTLHDKF